MTVVEMAVSPAVLLRPRWGRTFSTPPSNTLDVRGRAEIAFSFLHLLFKLWDFGVLGSGGFWDFEQNEEGYGKLEMLYGVGSEC